MVAVKIGRRRTDRVAATLRPDMHEQLEALCQLNGTVLSHEVVNAIRDRLVAHGMWPPLTSHFALPRVAETPDPAP